ncbi:MucBP domain-containing protein [Lactococcus lactis]|uniref:MucBP domain-containing protein n=1 Tax=Lactococcus lactis TaxID=1358 RepID=UPI0038784263
MRKCSKLLLIFWVIITLAINLSTTAFSETSVTKNKNLIINGDFSNGAEEWEFTPFDKNSKFEVKGGQAEIYSSGTLSQTFPISNVTELDFSLEYVEIFPGYHLHINVRALDGSGNEISNLFTEDSVTAEEKVEQLNVKVPEKTASLKYSLDLQSGGDVYIMGIGAQDSTPTPEDVVVKYLDENNNIIHEEQRISGNIGDAYDASAPEYKLDVPGYTLDETKLPGNSKGTISDQSQTVTYIYKGTLGLSVPENIDFGSYKLGSSNSALTYPLNSPTTVTNTTGKGWTLSGSLEKSDSDFSNYLMNGSEKLSDNATLATSASVSDITTVVSSSWKDKTGLWVDYSTGNTVRDDSEVLVWTLTPDVETGVKE